MHDLFASQDLLKIALKNAEKNKLKKISKIVIELGKTTFAHQHDDGKEHLDEIQPENLKFNMALLAKNTIAKDAQIDIIRTENNEIRLKEIEGE